MITLYAYQHGCSCIHIQHLVSRDQVVDAQLDQHCLEVLDDLGEHVFLQVGVDIFVGHDMSI